LKLTLAAADYSLVADSIFVINNHEEFTHGESVSYTGFIVGCPNYSITLSHIYVMDNSALRSDLDEFPDNTASTHYAIRITGKTVTANHLVVANNVNDFHQNSLGMFLDGTGPDQRVFLDDILIHDNVRLYPNPGVDEWNGRGSGIRTANNSDMRLEINNLRIYNQHSTILGAAVYAMCDTSIIRNSHIADCGHGSISVVTDHFEMDNVLINDCWNTRVEQSSHVVQAAIYGDARISNCTIVDSYGDYGKALYISGSDNGDEVDVLIENCIIENSCSYGEALGYFEEAITNFTVRYSNIDGGWEGEGNIDEDPLFTDPENGDYTFLEGSPCIDTGNPDPLYNDPEDPNHTGWPLWPSQGTLRNDMGCYGGPGAIDLWDYQDIPARPQPPVRPETIELHQNYPNPFNPTTMIEFTLPYPQDVQLTVYNILGQLVAVLAEGMYAAGLHCVTFNASVGATPRASPLSSGVYIYRLTAGDDIISRKMILVQ